MTQQFGHLQGASGLLEILGVTIEIEKDPQRPLEAVIRSMTEVSEFQALIDNQYATQIGSDEAQDSQLTAPVVTASFAETDSRVAINRVSSPSLLPAVSSGLIDKRNTENVMQNTRHDNDVRIARFWGHDESELLHQLAGCQALTNDRGYQDATSTRFPQKVAYRLSIVSSQDDWNRKIQLAIDLLTLKKSPLRAQEQGIFYCKSFPNETPRTAAMFPGQGSQHKGMLGEIFNASFEAQQSLARVDQALRRHGLPACSRWMTGEVSLAESDLSSTQLTMLTADVSAFAAASEWGLKPDFLIGHSFGEYAALVAAGTIDVESAIAITLSRAEAVAGCAHGVGAMLSIGASQREVQALMTGQSELFISHANAPRQTVVAGSVQRVNEFARVIKSAGIPALMVPVGSPFHTPLLHAAKAELKAALKQHRWRPPHTPVLSSVTGKFVADRDVIIENLTQQLTQPIDWIELIERLYAEDVRVFVEVGPGRVLTKLTQQILGERDGFVVSMDEPSIAPVERWLKIQAAMEVIGIQNASANASRMSPATLQSTASARVSSTFDRSTKVTDTVAQSDFALAPGRSHRGNHGRRRAG